MAHTILFAGAVPIERATLVSPGRYVTEASELRLPPGCWPDRAVWMAPGDHRGTVLRRGERRDDGGFEYSDPTGVLTVSVLND